MIIRYENFLNDMLFLNIRYEKTVTFFNLDKKKIIKL